MAQGVLSLYNPGGGYFSALYPNGTKVGVRHVTDFVYVSEFMDDHLADSHRHEMSAFVATELLTDTWMRALSPKDAAAAASDRTDHGPYGAYCGWPPLTIAAFARAGNHSAAANFLRATAFVTTLGPAGQANAVADPYLGSTTTFKPFEFTLSNEHGGTDMVDAVITAIFGLQAAAAPAQRQSPPAVANPTAPRGAPIFSCL